VGVLCLRSAGLMRTSFVSVLPFIMGDSTSGDSCVRFGIVMLFCDCDGLWAVELCGCAQYVLTAVAACSRLQTLELDSLNSSLSSISKLLLPEERNLNNSRSSLYTKLTMRQLSSEKPAYDVAHHKQSGSWPQVQPSRQRLAEELA
jgi:hypothetical protein